MRSVGGALSQGVVAGPSSTDPCFFRYFVVNKATEFGEFTRTDL